MSGEISGGSPHTVVIGWHELTFYGARCIARAIESSPLPVRVLSTGSAQEAQRRKASPSFPVQFISARDRLRWADLGMSPPQCFFETGWATPAFNSLARDAKRSGGRIVSFVDNIPRRDVRQALGAVYFRFALRGFYDAVMVPGKSSARLMQYFGMPSDKVYPGLYGADPEIFNTEAAPGPRKQEFLFVGQLITRKGVELLLQAFKRVRARHRDWTLRIVGAGPLRDRIHGDGVVQEDFMSAEELAGRYRGARFFVLPSLDEHWGVVVHEAALCGTPLLLSDRVGAAADLLDHRNGLVFHAGRVDALATAMEQAAALPLDAVLRMSRASATKAGQFGPEAWTRSFESILHMLQIA